MTIIHTQPQDNAMIEIALALAMAFFSIMVLTMVSMGVPAQKAGLDDGIAVAAASTASRANNSSNETVLVILHKGEFFDAQLKPIETSLLTGNVTLAIDPATAMAAAIDARKRLKGADVVVSTLDHRWRTRLEEMEP